MTNAIANERSCHALMQFVGENLDPAELSRLLSLKPSFSKRKGESLGTRRGAPTPHARRGVCSFSTRDVESNDINEHLRHLLRAISPVCSEIKTAVNRDHLLWKIVCFFDNPPSNLKSIVDTPIFDILTKLNIEFILDNNEFASFVEEEL